jgi:hypothetical protein
MSGVYVICYWRRDGEAGVASNAEPSWNPALDSQDVPSCDMSSALLSHVQDLSLQEDKLSHRRKYGERHEYPQMHILPTDVHLLIHSVSSLRSCRLPRRINATRTRLSILTKFRTNNLTRLRTVGELRYCLAVSCSASSLRLHANTCRITI